jgi:hypothetical protein
MTQVQNPRRILLAASLDSEKSVKLESAFWLLDAVEFAKVLYGMQSEIPQQLAAALLGDKVLSMNPATTPGAVIQRALQRWAPCEGVLTQE